MDRITLTEVGSERLNTTQVAKKHIGYMRIIELQSHSELWESSYKEEVQKLKTLIPKFIKASHHIGSTAIKSIKAKPTIDILIEVTNLTEADKYKDQFERLGHLSKGEYGIKGRRFFL